jgi:TPR repeat protein
MKMSPNNSIANSTSDDGNIEITKTKKQTKIQNRQANIAVVQTIAKQTREQNKNKNKNKNNCGNNSHNHSDGKCQKEEEVDLEKKSKEYMQYAAFVHGYPKALVQLANDALELAKQSESESLQNPYTYITPSMETIINVEELIQSNESFVEVAKFLYQQAIDRGNNNAAMYNLAHLLWTESQEIQNNNNDDNNDHDEQEEKMMKSIQLFHKAAMELNDIDALYFTGVQYITLLGTISSEEDTDDDNILNQNQSSSLHMNVIHQIVNQNDELKSITDLRQLGYEMIHKASDDDHAGASYYLSLLHRNGDMDLKVPVHPSICKFQHYLNLACDGDVMDSDALYLRAHCTYHNEDGYGNENEHGSSEHSMKEAFSDFMKAGEAGNPNGYISAGAMLHHGQIGIPQDQRRAFELYQEAGEMGSKDGWRNVVACHALGQGVPQCEQTAKYISKTMLSDDDVYQE